MALKIINGEKFLTPEDPALLKLKEFCEAGPQEFTVEWREGQFWLHSNIPKERPISLEVDRELSRHEDFFRKSSLQKELLARALGIKGAYRPKVLDLTGGMLGDSLLMLAFGCEVTTLERHPLIQFLIKFALANATHPKIEKFHFIPDNAGTFLSQAHTDQFDVIYFDPMFEDANEKTAPRKEMRIFRDVIGGDSDALEIFGMAKKLGPKRLVVKRPRHSAELNLSPSVQYIGKSTRYDVYFSL